MEITTKQITVFRYACILTLIIILCRVCSVSTNEMEHAQIVKEVQIKANTEGREGTDSDFYNAVLEVAKEHKLDSTETENLLHSFYL